MINLLSKLNKLQLRSVITQGYDMIKLEVSATIAHTYNKDKTYEVEDLKIFVVEIDLHDQWPQNQSLNQLESEAKKKLKEFLDKYERIDNSVAYAEVVEKYTGQNGIIWGIKKYKTI